jgi:hypothetical protein
LWETLAFLFKIDNNEDTEFEKCNRELNEES